MKQPKDAPKIEFPCDDYVIKVVGDVHPDYKPFVAGVLVKYDKQVTVDSFRETPSKKGTFVSLTVKMRIEDENDLNKLFEELKVNKLVRMVL